MPPAPSVTARDQEEKEVAFQVINQDNLPMAVIGQPILKPLDQDAQKSKPNVVVRPTRRITNNLEEHKQRAFAKSSGQINNNSDNIRTTMSTSHGNLCHNNSTAQMKLDDFKDQLDIDKFTKTLDSKLKRLQRAEIKQQKTPNSDLSTLRKPFVTTVRKGQFLEQPPETASLMGIKVEEQKNVKKNPKELKKMYAFASQPRLLSRTPPRSVHQTRCEAAAWAAAKLVGKVVGVRQDNDRLRDTSKALDKKALKENYSPTTDDQADRNIASIRAEQAKRRALARKRARNQQNKATKYSAQTLYAVPDHLQEKLLNISQLQHLLITKILSDAATQTEMEDSSTQNLPDLKQLKTDVQIQVHPTDLFDFNTQVQPIVEILVTKTIEEALIDILEEEELMTMKEQQRRFLDHMASKSSEDSLEQDNYFSDEIVNNFSKTMINNNYVPSLITSV